MDLDIHGENVILTRSAWRDAKTRLNDYDGKLVLKMLKTGKLIKKPRKEGEVGIVRHVNKKGSKVDIVLTQ